MRDVHHLRDLILGLAIVTPIACQTAPPTPTPGAQTPAAMSEAPAPEPPLAESEPAPEPPDANPSGVAFVTPQAQAVVSRARVFGQRAVTQELARRGHPSATLSVQENPRAPSSKCMTFKEVEAVQTNLYQSEYRRWKKNQKVSKTRAPRIFGGPDKPKKPRKNITKCPKFLTTSISYSRCGSNARTLSLAKQKKVRSGIECCYNPPPMRRRRPCGRLFFVEEAATRAQTQESAQWMGASVLAPSGLPEALAMRAAEAWLEDALEEHASIAAFSRATLELMALGAPADLLAEYQAASLDEIRHAKMCFSLVASLLGRDVSAGALDVEGPRDDLDVIFADVFWGGCVGESVAALCAKRAHTGCTWTPARDALAHIAEDEARHAALAWSTLSFLGERFPERLRDLLSNVRPPEASPAHGFEGEGSGWAALGRLSPAQDARAAQDAWTHLISPMIAQMLGEAS